MKVTPSGFSAGGVPMTVTSPARPVSSWASSGPSLSAGHDDGQAGVERPVAGGAMGEAAAFVLVLVRETEPALVEAGGDHHRAGGVLLVAWTLGIAALGAAVAARRDVD